MSVATTPALDVSVPAEAEDRDVPEESLEPNEDRIARRRRRLAAARTGARVTAVILAVLMVVGVGLWLLTVSAAQRTATSQALDPDIPVAAAEPLDDVDASTSTAPDAAPQGTTQQAARGRQVSASWVQEVSARTGVPARAMTAYANAQLQLEAESPGCGLSWNTLAAIGTVESANGTHNGTVLLDSGRTSRPIRGPVLNGSGVGAVRDTDGGRWDGSKRWDRALGPMQFIPSTWRKWASDGNGDGVADPDQIDDAALTAGRYLCASGRMKTSQGWLAGIYAYNHSSAYVQKVAETANAYAAEAS